MGDKEHLLNFRMGDDEHVVKFRIEKDENGRSYIVCASQEEREIFEAIFIDWVHRGYMEPVGIRYGGLSYRLTDWGKQHFNDIMKVKDF
ncbi:hypothetical protein ES708_00007 [subsurface metagenome]